MASVQEDVKDAPDTSLNIDDAVYVMGEPPRLTGIVKYVGETSQEGDDRLIGIVMTGGSMGRGNTDGFRKGVRHFTCEQNNGMFIEEGKLEKRRLTKLEELRLRRASKHKKRDMAFGIQYRMALQRLEERKKKRLDELRVEQEETFASEEPTAIESTNGMTDTNNSEDLVDSVIYESKQVAGDVGGNEASARNNGNKAHALADSITFEDSVTQEDSTEQLARTYIKHNEEAQTQDLSKMKKLTDQFNPWKKGKTGSFQNTGQFGPWEKGETHSYENVGQSEKGENVDQTNMRESLAMRGGNDYRKNNRASIETSMEQKMENRKETRSHRKACALDFMDLSRCKDSSLITPPRSNRSLEHSVSSGHFDWDRNKEETAVDTYASRKNNQLRHKILSRKSWTKGSVNTHGRNGRKYLSHQNNRVHRHDSNMSYSGSEKGKRYGTTHERNGGKHSSHKQKRVTGRGSTIPSFRAKKIERSESTPLGDFFHSRQSRGFHASACARGKHSSDMMSCCDMTQATRSTRSTRSTSTVDDYQSCFNGTYGYESRERKHKPKAQNTLQDLRELRNQLAVREKLLNPWR